MPLGIKQPIREIPTTIRDFDRFLREQLTVSADNDSVSTAQLKTQAVTLAKVASITADRILGKITPAGSPEELTAAQVVTLLQAVTWIFALAVKFDGNIGFYGKSPIAQPTNITDAVTAHALNATFDDTEVEAALDALGTKFNDLKDNVIEALGLSA